MSSWGRRREKGGQMGHFIIIVVNLSFLLFCSLFFSHRPAKKYKCSAFLRSVYSRDAEVLIFTSQMNLWCGFHYFSLTIYCKGLPYSSLLHFFFFEGSHHWSYCILLHFIACRTWNLTVLFIYLSKFQPRGKYTKSVNTFVKD